MTSRTSAGWPTIEKTTSDASATARGDLPAFAPRSSKGRSFADERLKAVTPNPAARTCPHIDEPMTPVPIHPTRVLPGAISMPMTAPRLDRPRP